MISDLLIHGINYISMESLYLYTVLSTDAILVILQAYENFTLCTHKIAPGVFSTVRTERSKEFFVCFKMADLST